VAIKPVTKGLVTYEPYFMPCACHTCLLAGLHASADNIVTARCSRNIGHHRCYCCYRCPSTLRAFPSTIGRVRELFAQLILRHRLLIQGSICAAITAAISFGSLYFTRFGAAAAVVTISRPPQATQFRSQRSCILHRHRRLPDELVLPCLPA
jgi:hypothetical protein